MLLHRPSLDAVLELLALLLPILATADPPLAAHIAGSGVPPFFALSLFITWFAHNLAQLGQAARLFDLFIASHPLMPLYAAVAVLMVTPLPCLLAPVHDPGGGVHALQHVRKGSLSSHARRGAGNTFLLGNSSCTSPPGT